MKKPLIVYKASAGSGKTFTLAVEYISLLVRDPECHRHILAVTFTNKATEEMKMRIISQLYGIAHRDPDSGNYLRAVMSKTGLDEQTIVSRAATALSYLIHHYSDFRIQTIDAFFQSVLRNLARELRLTANLRIDLNDQQVAEQAVDEMIEALDSSHDVLEWINDYIRKNIEDDKGWNVIKDIKSFSMNIFRDFYKRHAAELDTLTKNGRFFTEYIKDLRGRRDRIAQALNGKAGELLATLQRHGFDDKDYYKYGDKGSVWKYIHVQANQKGVEPLEIPTRVADFIDDPSRMVSPKAPGTLVTFATDTLIPLLNDYHETHRRNWCEYQSAVLTLRHLSQLRLLKAIADTVDEIDRETNRFQLSNTQTLLHELIADSDTPFIFEKMGAQLRHIMIDEFQDTSTIQWENFLVLLRNCLSQAGCHSLIVGDVKQSIYRWRSGDWRLLNNIEQQFTDDELETCPMSRNFRSEERIVRFNNTFFTEAVSRTVSELEADHINDSCQMSNAYREIEQEPNKQNGQGRISITLLPSEHYEETIMELLLETLDELAQRGEPLHEIAILARSNRDIQLIAEVISRERPTLRIVSDEAFRLDASLAVNTLIMALRVLENPDERLTQGILAKNYQQQILNSGLATTSLLMSESYEDLLPAGFLDQRAALLQLPMTELADRLYNLFQLEKLSGESAYVCTFMDYLNSFLQDHAASIHDFQTYWDDTLARKTIQSEEEGGIRILSIHKSKGLEFDHVIIPFCDWPLEQGGTIWCEQKTQDPFDKLPIIPIDFNKKKMAGTVYEPDYREEHLQNTVDNMNMLYVAFTRAGKSLTVTGKRMSDKRKKDKLTSSTSNNRSEIIEECLGLVAQKLEGSVLTGTDDKGPIHFEWGDYENGNETFQPEDSVTAASLTQFQEPHDAVRNPFTVTPTPCRVVLQSWPSPVEFRQSNKSRDFISGEDEQPSDRLRYIQLGNVLHELFSHIQTLDDIAPQLLELEHEGIIYNDDVTAEQLRQQLSAAFQDPQVADWFDRRWRVFNECTLLEPVEVVNPKTQAKSVEVVEHRPDRVITDGHQVIVIDFKFGKPRKIYTEQVQRYMEKLREMGYQDVKGYLWYVLRSHVEEVVPR